MKVLFAVSNEEISESIIKKYQKEYKQIISYKNVYYFNAILKELQKDKSYDRIVISEDLEAFTHSQYEQIDKFIFEKLDGISDEATNSKGNDIPIILICSDRRTKSEDILVKLFGIGVYNAIIGNDRSVDEVCKLINRPRAKKDAKAYYKIDIDEVSYQAENENDVSEMEIQNIIAHYKRLGKNEDRYVDSFNNIAAQYNDTQLRIISKFLPLNVRAVLEEQSPKYQQIMSFRKNVSDNLRVKNKEEDNGPTAVLLKQGQRKSVMSNPVVIPSNVNMSGTKKLSRVKPSAIPNEVNRVNNNIDSSFDNRTENLDFEGHNRIQEDVDEILGSIENIQESNSATTVNPIHEVEEVQPVKRGRGRPRKNPVQQDNGEPKVKRGRGRPRKNPIPEPIPIEEPTMPETTTILPGFEDDNNFSTSSFLPGFEDNDNFDDNKYSGQENNNSDGMQTILPGFEEDDDEETNDSWSNVDSISNEDSNNDELEFNNVNIESDYNQNNYNTVSNNVNNNYDYNSDEKIITPIVERDEEEDFEEIDLSNLLSDNKKIVTFVGTSKNGTSFVVNNLAERMSSIGVKTAILDTTRNRNSYYIYTKNEEELRRIASNSIVGLSRGEANGIQVNKNLSVYTSLPSELDAMKNVDKILETLLKNYSLILIDTDFDTPSRYFKQSQETYLVQSMDILTIQPLTKFLRELKGKNILDESKLRIILNKTIRIKGIKNETIIGGMAFYNDPAMSFMTELFDRNHIKYVSIPFEEEIYSKYLEGIIECEISLKGYSKTFMQVLNELGNMVYPMTSQSSGRNREQPQNNDAFSPNMNDTLNRMKNNF